MADKATMLIAGIIYLAILYALVRPGSTGATLVNQVTGVLADLVRGVSGQTFNAKTNSWSPAS